MLPGFHISIRHTLIKSHGGKYKNVSVFSLRTKYTLALGLGKCMGKCRHLSSKHFSVWFQGSRGLMFESKIPDQLEEKCRRNVTCAVGRATDPPEMIQQKRPHTAPCRDA